MQNGDLGYIVILLLSIRTRFDFLDLKRFSLHELHTNVSGMLDLRIFAQDKWIHVLH